jgi:prepilin peptidase CpaA
MTKPFFPGAIFGWVFCLSLLGMLAVASWTDLQRMVVPKWLTLSALAAGLVFNTARGAWLGALGLEAWKLGPRGALAGAADGLLFGVAGFAAGFALFFPMWLLGTCGGGDVKLFAALGAWVGPYLACIVLVVTGIVVFLILLLRIAAKAFRLVTGSELSAGRGRKEKGLTTYALPLALSSAVVLLWAFRADLQLVP